LAGRLRRARDVGAAGYQVAHVRRQSPEVPTLIGERLLPVGHDRPVPRDDPRRRNTAKVVHDRQPSAQAAVENRNVLRHHKIAGKQRGGRRIEDGEVVVGVRRAPRVEDEDAMSEIELEFVADQQRRRNDPHVRHEFITHEPAKRVDVVLSARRQCPRQVPVTDEHDAFAGEGRVAKDMVRMHVGIHHIADRLGRDLAHGRRQTASLAHAAAGIDDGDRVVAHDKSDIGDGAGVRPRHQRDVADMDKYAGGRFLHVERRRWLRPHRPRH
jgi:hypothetical protein